MNASRDASLAYLLGRLAIVESRVRAAVARRRARDTAPDDPFRGLYLTDEHVDKLLLAPEPMLPPEAGADTARERVERTADEAEANGSPVRLRTLARTFDLQPLDVELLLIVLAPDLDARFERLYGYLHDDVTRRRASIGLALELCGVPVPSGEARHRLSPGSPLVEGGLVLVEETDRPFLTRHLRCPDRVTAHLLGDDRPDPALAPLLLQPDAARIGDPAALSRALRADALLGYVRETPGSSGRTFATAAFTELGLPTLSLDLSRLDNEDAVEIARVAAREARLRRAGIVAGPIDALAERDPRGLRAFAELPTCVVLTGRRSWDAAWSRTVPVLVDAPAPTPDERARVWEGALDGDAGAEVDVAAVTTPFRLAPDEVLRAATSARLHAAMAGSPVGEHDLRLGARSQNASGLERLARRIEPQVGWDDLVLPALTSEQLHELAARARHRERVVDEWGMRPGAGRGRGVTALFAGDSGTGKTMSAEVIASELGLDLYAVNLATVVDKYVGETEKNLDRIFSEADGVNGVLLFDEADALFGKRSEVRDAHDRYANIEVAYLLQRMESFDGLAVLSTNLRANVDEAFTRRLDAVIDFPMPDAELRRELWDKCLAPAVPRAGDLDLDFCAEAFELSGGNIRSIALTAAYLAAASGRPVSMADLMRATHHEYRKMGRLVVEAEFGRYFGLVTS